MLQGEVAYLVEAARQHMLEEAVHKLVAAEPADAPAATLAVASRRDAVNVLGVLSDAGTGERGGDRNPLKPAGQPRPRPECRTQPTMS
jgi:hypothetical protein